MQLFTGDLFGDEPLLKRTPKTNSVAARTPRVDQNEEGASTTFRRLPALDVSPQVNTAAISSPWDSTSKEVLSPSGTKSGRLPSVEPVPAIPPPPPLQLVQSVWKPILRFEQHEQVDLQQVIHTALVNSPEIRVLEADVGIATAEVQRQQAAFDWTAFINSNWDDRNTPVGSVLDGAQNRLINTGQNNNFGVRQQNQIGGSTNIGQDLNFADSNSSFFDPRDQATARIGITYEQPLLQGGGSLVATSRYNIAIASAETSREEMLRGLQSHILQTVNAYWELAARRGQYAIQKRNYDRAAETFNLVENRGDLDVGPAQAARSEATLASRKTELLRNEYAVVLAQERLLRLMLGAAFNNHIHLEIIPSTDLLSETASADPDVQQQIALQNRPEIRRSLQEIKQASIEQGVAENQLLPVLGLTLSMSNQGLQGDRQIFPAISDQLTIANASYGLGLAYEMPFGNRAAKSNLLQSKLRLRRFQSELEIVIADVVLEVRNAAHNLTLAVQELELSTTEMLLARRELEIIETRYKLLIDGDNVGSLYLDNLLQTQERLAAAEIRFVSAAVGCQQSAFDLQLANGLLLRESPNQI